ncbi:MAG: DJ-1/PfpI family protein [Saprospiraceae bacterium]|nr:DJ-1/PfpI family protein [Saprospiraceae bacterium]
MELLRQTAEQRAMSLQMRDMTIGFFLQDGVEVLDFAGPMEVFSYAGFNVITIARTREPIKSQGILTIVPDYSIAEAPSVDVLAFFGGGGAGRVSRDAEIIDWIKGQKDVQYHFSVCTGAFFLGEAGLLDGHQATTFHSAIDDLRRRFPKATVLSDVRYVDNGKVITTAGISAGIDGALHFVQKFAGEDAASRIAENMEYDKWRPNEGLVVKSEK